MTEEVIKAMTEEYLKNVVTPNKKVAEVAFISGLQAAMEYIKQKLMEL